MARSKNPQFNGLSGKVGNMVYKQYDNGKRVVVAGTTGKRQKEPSEKQQTQMRNFTYANMYANNVYASPAHKAFYEKGIHGTKRSAHAVAMGDFMQPPVIHEIDTRDYNGMAGDVVRVRATDDFKVMSVTVTIKSPDGQVIEKGEARARGKRGLWRMITAAGNAQVEGTVVEAVAVDYAKNQAKLSATVAARRL